MAHSGHAEVEAHHWPGTTSVSCGKPSMNSPESQQTAPMKAKLTRQMCLDDIERRETCLKIIRLRNVKPHHSVKACREALRKSNFKFEDALEKLIGLDNQTSHFDGQPDPQASLIVTLRVLPTIPPFPFMHLPLEIRIMVYKEALVMPGAILVEEYNYDETEYEQGMSHAAILRLLATSKTILRESASIYFRYNEFEFRHFDDLTKFLTCIGPENRRNVTHFMIRWVGKAPAKAAKLLAGCVGLRHLILEVTPSSARGPGYDSLMCMHGLRDLLRIRGLATLDVKMFDRFGYFPSWIVDETAFRAALEVMKLPQSSAYLKRQEKKDFPNGKAARTIFGKTNVKTRTEKKLWGEQ